MLHRGPVARAVLAAAVAVTILARGVWAAPAVPPGSWLESAVWYLKTRGLLPLWVGARRPLLGQELEAVLRELERYSEAALAERDRAVVEGVRAYVRSLTLSVASPYGALGLTGAGVWLAGPAGSGGWSVGGQWWPDRGELSGGFLSFPLGDVEVLLGRAPVTWGTDPFAGLVFSAYAGGLDRVEVAFEPWPWLRYSKFFGRVDSRITVVGQRADVRVAPNLRVGVSDAVLMVGTPYWLYLLNPVPPLNALDVGFAIFNKEVHRTRNDNGAIGLDFEWVPFPGLRYYGELLVDDVQFVWPTLISPEFEPAQWGATVGVHWLRALGSWDVWFQYTVVPNWTYAAVAGSTHWMARGLPLGHPVGNDFDLWHLRLAKREGLGGWDVWLSYLRKGEGRPDRFWTSPDEARSRLFLTGVVEHSWILGVEYSGAWEAGEITAGPWVAYRTNAGHVPGAVRWDWGVSLAALVRF